MTTAPVILFRGGELHEVVGGWLGRSSRFDHKYPCVEANGQ
jgi:hypothetical protein